MINTRNIILAIVSINIVAVAFLPTASAVTLNKSLPINYLGMVGWWTFDGKDTSWNTNTTVDRSGNGNTGTMTNMSTTTSPIEGKIGQGFKLDGTNDYVAVAEAASLAITGDITISGWFKQDSLKWVHLVDKYPCYYLDMLASGRLSFRSTGYVNLDSNGIYTPGRWYHFVALKNSTGRYLYVNGQYDNFSSDSGAFSSSCSTGILIGRVTFDATTYNFNGIADDVRIYNRALSTSEILQLYNLGM